MKNIMIDIETMGSISYSAIVSIGAVKFDMETGETGETFYTNVDLQSCIDAGLIINADTLMWWLKQGDEARNKLSQNTISLTDALIQFNAFVDKSYEVWGNSARFDLGIMQNAYNSLKINIPWDFRKERCVRTLVAFSPEIKNNEPINGVLHNALDDCYLQIRYCSKIYNKLKI